MAFATSLNRIPFTIQFAILLCTSVNISTYYILIISHSVSSCQSISVEIINAVPHIFHNAFFEFFNRCELHLRAFKIGSLTVE